MDGDEMDEETMLKLAAALKEAQQQQQKSSTTNSQSIQSLVSEIAESKCDCLNQSDAHTIKHMLINAKSKDAPNSSYYLESSADEQLLLYIPFNNKVNIKTIGFISSGDECPSTIKLYVNRTNVDFDDVDDVKANEVIQLTQDQAENGKPINLKFVNFRNVNSLTIFVADNHGAETSILKSIKLTGQIIEDRSSQQIEKIEE